MKRLFAVLLALSAAQLGHAQVSLARATLAAVWDLDGEAADADQIVTLANGVITDAGNYTITADPDVCRLVDITVVDTDLSSGTLTAVGTGCLGEARSCSFAFTAGDDTGVQTLTCTDGQGAYFSDVTAVTTGTMVGESDETFTMGYTSNSVNGWPMYGKVNPPGPNGEWSVDPFGYFDVPYPITTSGSSSTTVTGVNGAQDAFAAVSVGDLLVIQTGGTSYERKVTAKASADSITVNSSITIPATGVQYRYRKFYFSTNPAQVLAVPVSGYRTALFSWAVDANASTGGVVTLLECTQDRVEFPTRWETLTTATVASGSSQDDTPEAIDLTALPYSFCRFGASFGTADDADAAAEDISISVTLLR